jgi:hypothetical protein
MPETNDPMVAALLVEIRYLRESITELKAENSAIRKSIGEIETVVTKVRGGYVALILLGGALMWTLGFWDKVAKLWN